MNVCPKPPKGRPVPAFIPTFNALMLIKATLWRRLSAMLHSDGIHNGREESLRYAMQLPLEP